LSYREEERGDAGSIQKTDCGVIRERHEEINRNNLRVFLVFLRDLRGNHYAALSIRRMLSASCTARRVSGLSRSSREIETILSMR
jgi:hypothetical protein